MADLKGLIRLHRWQLDEKRRALAELEALAERLAAEAARMEAELAEERELAARSEVPVPNFALYVKAMLERRAKLAETQAQVARQIEAARDEIADAFQELKKYEIAQADRELRATQRLRRIETATYDEIAVIRHHRRKTAEGGD